MMLFRSVTAKDLDSIVRITKNINSGLITTLPQDEFLLNHLISHSLRSFSAEVKYPENEYYLFVLEDPITKKVIGTSAILANTGFNTPFYSYKLSTYTNICQDYNIRSENDRLILVNDNQYQSELCTLFLTPEYRKKSNGILLSKARLLFIATNYMRFHDVLMAEIRGVSDENMESPFWNAIGKHFFHMSFAEADYKTLATNKQFIADLMPKDPIYVNMLPPEARAVIGKPHTLAEGALHMLCKEGFKYNKYVDIFDAGPTLNADKKNIKIIRHSKHVYLQKIVDKITPQSTSYLIANSCLDFRATIAPIILENSQCILDASTAELLQIQIGESICIAPLI